MASVSSGALPYCRWRAARRSRLRRRLAIRYIELRYIGSYSGFVRTLLSRRLKHVAVTPEQRSRLHKHFSDLVLREERTQEFRDYAKLWSRLITDNELQGLAGALRTQPNGEAKAAYIVGLLRPNPAVNRGRPSAALRAGPGPPVNWYVSRLALIPCNVCGLPSFCSHYFSSADAAFSKGQALRPGGLRLDLGFLEHLRERSADEATRTKLRDAMERAEEAIRVAYGSVHSHPMVYACVSERCYEAFGGRGSVAKVYGDRILLSPRGLNWHFLAHEWSHAEMRSRLTLLAWWHMPQWFDEGVAVTVSEAPEHSEEHWQFLVTSETPRPTPEELHALNSLWQWLDAVHRYGEDKNVERKAKGEPELNPVYAAAGHELRAWLTHVGSQGLLL